MTFAYASKTISFTAVLYPVRYKSSRGQNRGVSESGTVRVYDRGSRTRFIQLVFKNSNHSQLAELREFIQDTIKFAYNTFIFTPDANHNVAGADGEPVRVRYWSSNFIEQQNRWHIYEYPDIILRIENDMDFVYADDLNDAGFLGGPTS